MEFCDKIETAWLQSNLNMNINEDQNWLNAVKYAVLYCVEYEILLCNNANLSQSKLI